MKDEARCTNGTVHPAGARWAVRAKKLWKTKIRNTKKENENLETNLANLILEIKNGNYQLGKQRIFKLYRSNERVIRTLPFLKLLW